MTTDASPSHPTPACSTECPCAVPRWQGDVITVFSTGERLRLVESGLGFYTGGQVRTFWYVPVATPEARA